QVAAALDGGLVTNAVNIPSVGAEDLEVLGPFVPLAAALGRLALELARGEPGKIALEYYGELAEHDTRLLTVAALNGALPGRGPGGKPRQARRRPPPRGAAPSGRGPGPGPAPSQFCPPPPRARRASPARRSAARTASGSSRHSASSSRSSSRRG